MQLRNESAYEYPSDSLLRKTIEIVDKYKEIDTYRNTDVTFVEKGNTKRKKPLVLFFSGDWHIGSKSCDHNRLFNDLDYITNNISHEDFRMFLLGDLIDNVYTRFKNAESVFGYLSPVIQRDILIELFNKIGPYIDISCWGNHDVEWDEKYIGFSELSRIFKKFSTFFYGRGLVKYKVGKQVYKIYVSHSFSGRSWFHPLHGNIRGWLESHADIVVSGHGHNFGYLNDFYGVDDKGCPMERHLIQVGTYNYINDKYSERYFGKPVCRNGCLLLYNDQYKISFFQDFKDGINFFKNCIDKNIEN